MIINHFNLLCFFLSVVTWRYTGQTDDYYSERSMLGEKLIITLQECSGRGPEKVLLTLTRGDPAQAWGFSCHGGEDLEHWGGLLSGDYNSHNSPGYCQAQVHGQVLVKFSKRQKGTLR